MKIIRTRAEWADFDPGVSKGELVGYVPTMGALHEGHKALFEVAAQRHRVWMASLFVNPLQFDKKSDFEAYPNTLERDLAILKEAHCSVVFAPTQTDFYSSPVRVKLDFGLLTCGMEGKQRPDHFSGVGVVLARMFHLLAPDVVYLGQKDWQQFLVVRQLIQDLGFAIKAHAVCTVREKDGVAYASRNQRLSPKGRLHARELYAGLKKAQTQLLKHGTSIQSVRQDVIQYWKKETPLHPEYLEIVDSYSLKPLCAIQDAPYVSLCAAVSLENVRLIDNIFLDAQPKELIKPLAPQHKRQA